MLSRFLKKSAARRQWVCAVEEAIAAVVFIAAFASVLGVGGFTHTGMSLMNAGLIAALALIAFLEANVNKSQS